MAEEGIYVNTDDFNVSPTCQADSGTEGRIYANESPGGPERATASKPSGAVKNYTRWAAVCLGLLCVLLLALNIGLGIKYLLEKRQLQAEREHLLASHVNITIERDQVSASNTNLTRQVDQLLLASNTNLTRQMDQLLRTNGQLQARISKLEKRCPSGWRYFNTKCYLISSSKNTWSESRQRCKDIGGDLAIINDKEEQVFIHGLGIPVWIGLRKIQGGWKWVDNTLLSTKYWDSGQPNDENEDCVVSDCPAGDPFSIWHDYLCSVKHSFICEMSSYMLY
ncbi:C-type lectin domain family 4 member M-like [Alosa alosa]|uniref:C-type lectin domain family 4 member M-like n=1 Tax=Alosa alosa TaxID=278164 RepID=UPI002015075F|nr:C-type lectin domain family 4 member M-like [Alosa alosa]